jgi:hypothetical protein
MSTNLFDFTRKREQRERLRKQEEDRRKRALEKIEKEEKDKNDDFVASVLAKAKRAGSAAAASTCTATIASKTTTTTATRRQHDPRHEYPRGGCDDNDDDDIHSSSTHTTKKKTLRSLSSTSDHSGSMGSPISLLKQQEPQNRAMALAAQRKSPTDKWLVPTSASSASKSPSPGAKRDLGKWLNASNSIKDKDHKHRLHSAVTKAATAADTPSSPVSGRHRSRSSFSPPVSPPLLLSQSQDHGFGTTTKSAWQPQHTDARNMVAVASWPPKKGPLNDSSNDSDSDVDLMAHFEAVNQKKGPHQLSKQGDMSTAPPQIEPLRNDSNDNDKVEMRNRIALDRRTMEDGSSDDERNVDTRCAPPLRRKRKLDTSFMNSGDEDEDDESSDHDNERRRGKSMDPRKSYRAMRKQDKNHRDDASSDNDNERQKTKQSLSANAHLRLQQRRENDTCPASRDENGESVGVLNNDVHQDLWSDSSEHEPDSDAERNQKQRRVVRKQTTKKRPSTTKSEVGSRNNSRTAYESEDDAQYCDGARGRDLLRLDDTLLQQALHPTLKDPKFDIDPLVPLVLCDDNEEDDSRYQVPASMNRYLRPYQREGIMFMYKALAANRGVVLGDDMVSFQDATHFRLGRIFETELLEFDNLILAFASRCLFC